MCDILQITRLWPQKAGENSIKGWVTSGSPWVGVISASIAPNRR